MMEGVLPEAWDLILFKTMVLYIYKIEFYKVCFDMIIRK